ncbi:MAG: hypothetical protein Aurels2KO_34490 [Aureliella sp.]
MQATLFLSCLVRIAGPAVHEKRRESNQWFDARRSWSEYIAYSRAEGTGLEPANDFALNNRGNLDTKHRMIGSHQITVGTLDASLVHPREVFRTAIRDSSSSVLLAHNHPSGDPTPSREDINVTARLTEAGKLIGIAVLDHIVLAREGCLSVREYA